MHRWTVAIALAACSPADDVTTVVDPGQPGTAGPSQPGRDYETLELGAIELHYFPEIVFCEGELASLQTHLARATAVLGIEPQDRYVVEWVDDADVDRRCPPNSGGCVRGDIGIGTRLSTLIHELNHLITAPFHGSLPLWTEGIAVALEPRPIVLDPLASYNVVFDPVLMIDERDSLKISYPTAGHLVRVLWSDLGRAAMIDIVAGSERGALDDNLAVFADAASTDFDQYAEDYLATHPVVMASLLPEPAPLPLIDERIVHVFDLDCSSPSTRYVEQTDGLTSSILIEVAVEGRYELTVSNGSASVFAFPLADGPLPITQTDMGSALTADPVRPAEGILGPGVFRLSVTGVGTEAQTVAVDLHRKLGADDAVPE